MSCGAAGFGLRNVPKKKLGNISVGLKSPCFEKATVTGPNLFVFSYNCVFFKYLLFFTNYTTNKGRIT